MRLAIGCAISVLTVSTCLCQPQTPKPRRCIVDTDCGNEVDDQHAVTYAILAKELKVEGVCVEHHNRPGSLDRNFAEAQKVVELIGAADEVPVLRGAPKPMPDPQTPVDSAAVDFIIERALDPDEKPPLFLIPVGPLTNVASAWLKEPRIAERVVVVWLGGTPEGMTREFNARNDLNANRCVANSNLQCYFMPASVGVRVLVTDAQAHRYMSQCPIGKYLASLWSGSRGLFDVGAVGACINPNWFQTRRARVGDDLLYVWDKAGPFYVHTDIDADKVTRDFLKRFPDQEPPKLLSAWAEGPNKVRLVLNEPLAARALDKRNFRVRRAQPRKISRAGEVELLLTISRPLKPDAEVTVQAFGLRDRQGNPALRDQQIKFTYRQGLMPGVRVEYFPLPQEQVNQVPDLTGRQPDAVTTLRQINLPASMGPFPGSKHKDWFAARFTSLLECPADGEYEFTVTSDDGAKLWLGEELVVVNDGVHGMKAVSGKVTLTKGLCALKVTYFEWDNPAGLVLSWRPPGGDQQVIPLGRLWLRTDEGS
ncbi:MAG: nucleoside hydrolase [Armatimonadota bacterium]